jgi:organic hydroperoxide reductase OsmC/OhrA
VGHYADVMPPRARVLHFDITVDRAGDARSALGGSPLPREVEWWAEHLVLAGLVRCTLASMDYAARRAGLNSLGVGTAHGVVAKRDDGLHAFVSIETQLEVDLAPAPDNRVLEELVAKAEHGCFVSNSLTARPRHRWIVNGVEVH